MAAQLTPVAQKVVLAATGLGLIFALVQWGPVSVVFLLLAARAGAYAAASDTRPLQDAASARMEHEAEAQELHARLAEAEIERKAVEVKRQQIVEREHAYEALRATAALHRALFESSAWAIFTTDAAGIIQSFNATAEAWSGYSSAQLVGRATPAILHDGEEVAQRALSLSTEPGAALEPGFEVLVRLPRGGTPDEREWTWTRRDGRRLRVLVSFNPLRDPLGTVSGFLGIATDLTERDRVRQELTQAKESAERANRAKSEFLANMSHELRTPLNSIIGFSNILTKNKDEHLNAKELTYLARISDNGRHLLGLINTILDLSKIESGKSEIVSEPVALQRLVREVVAQFEAQTQDRELELVCEVPEGLAPVEMDEQKMRQVLINLVGNALKFTEKGSVTVRIEADPVNSRPLAVEVIDTGVGISPERQSAVFEAFQQADNTTARKYGGTGLGLTITRALLEQMGFGVELSSELGRGSTFRICLWNRPQSAAQSEVKVMSAEEARRLRIAEKLVLIIVDDADARLLMHRVVQEQGCRVVSAPSGAWGLDLARLNQPDIVLLDAMMPRVDAGEVVRGIRADPAIADTPIVVVTGAPEADRGTLPGVEDYVRKPAEPAELASALQRHLFPKRGKIVVVDDDPFVTEMLSYALKEKGAEVRSAANGQVAFEVMLSYQPDLIILDMMMPVMDGRAFLQKFQEHPRRAVTPILVLTAKMLSAEETTELASLGATVKVKGESLDLLLKEVFARLPERRGRNRPRRTVVRVAPKLAHLIPGFMRNRRKDIEAIRKALDAGDLALIQRLGHQLRGAGGGYGFTDLTDVGHRLEVAASTGSTEELGRALGALTQYLDSVEVIYQ